MNTSIKGLYRVIQENSPTKEKSKKLKSGSIVCHSQLSSHQSQRQNHSNKSAINSCESQIQSKSILILLNQLKKEQGQNILLSRNDKMMEESKRRYFQKWRVEQEFTKIGEDIQGKLEQSLERSTLKEQTNEVESVDSNKYNEDYMHLNQQLSQTKKQHGMQIDKLQRQNIYKHRLEFYTNSLKNNNKHISSTSNHAIQSAQSRHRQSIQSQPNELKHKTVNMRTLILVQMPKTQNKNSLSKFNNDINNNFNNNNNCRYINNPFFCESFQNKISSKQIYTQQSSMHSQQPNNQMQTQPSNYSNNNMQPSNYNNFISPTNSYNNIISHNNYLMHTQSTDQDHSKCDELYSRTSTFIDGTNYSRRSSNSQNDCQKQIILTQQSNSKLITLGDFIEGDFEERKQQLSQIQKESHQFQKRDSDLYSLQNQYGQEGNIIITGNPFSNHLISNSLNTLNNNENNLLLEQKSSEEKLQQINNATNTIIQQITARTVEQNQIYIEENQDIEASNIIKKINIDQHEKQAHQHIITVVNSFQNQQQVNDSFLLQTSPIIQNFQQTIIPSIGSDDKNSLQEQQNIADNSSPLIFSSNLQQEIQRQRYSTHYSSQNKFELPLQILSSSPQSCINYQKNSIYFAKQPQISQTSRNGTPQHGRYSLSQLSQNMLKQQYYKGKIERPQTSMLRQKKQSYSSHFPIQQQNYSEQQHSNNAIQLLKPTKFDYKISSNQIKKVNNSVKITEGRALTKNTNLFQYIEKKCEETAFLVLDQKIKSSQWQDDLIYQEYVNFIKKTGKESKNNESQSVKHTQSINYEMKQQNYQQLQQINKRNTQQQIFKCNKEIQTIEFSDETKFRTQNNPSSPFSSTVRNSSTESSSHNLFTKGQITRKLKKYACKFSAVGSQFDKLNFYNY